MNETWCEIHNVWIVACCDGLKDAERGPVSAPMRGSVVTVPGPLPEPLGTAVMAVTGCDR